MNKVNHPDHYNTIPDIECIDVIEHFNLNLGNAIKYIWRAGLKDGVFIDLHKAIWYLRREIARLKLSKDLVCPFCESNNTGCGYSGSDKHPYQYMCFDCYAKGPRSDKRDDAKDLWLYGTES